VDYIVITTVDRDDLPDSGASHFAKTVSLMKQLKPSLLIEALTGDFKVTLFANLRSVEDSQLQSS